MRVRQWEVWKCRPPGFESDHWFVVISAQERCDNPRQLLVNGLACFSLRGSPDKLEVHMNLEDAVGTAKYAKHANAEGIGEKGLFTIQ